MDVFEILQYEFMRNALLAGLLASIAAGIIGTYVIVKRIVFISGGIAHASFGGIGLGYYLGISPIIGAVGYSLASAIGIGVISKNTQQREDTAIGILWALGMASGIIFINLTPGYAPDLFSYLFGNILTVPRSDLLLMAVLNLVIVAAVMILYKEFLTLSFDEEFAEIVGLPVDRLYFALLSVIGLTVVLLIRIVGIILVIALLTIPAAIAQQMTTNLKVMMVYSVALSSLFSTCGLWVSFVFDIPSGATIILLAGFTFIIVSVVNNLRSTSNESQN
jgi:zinc transport system permease protein